jgi:hypothetical protein
MITERELIEAIRECEEEPPSFTSIKKLANLYIVYNQLYGKAEPKIKTEKNGEFWNAVNGKDAEKVLVIMAELMETLEVLYPKVYGSIIKKLSDL